MKKKWYQKVVAMSTMLAMGMTLLTGCGNEASSGSGSGSSEGGGVTTSIDGSDSSAYESAGDVVFPLEEPLTLTVFVKAPNNSGGGTYQDNYVTAWIKEQTNIQLDFQFDLAGDDATTKLNLLMTDPSSMPDIFLATGWSKSEAQSYGQQGLILPLNDYLVDAENWNIINEECPTRLSDITMTDGNIYTFGAINECYHCNYQSRMWIYEPWVELLNDGYMPETTEELYEYLQKVKTQDPNGNGVADEIPMTGYVGGWATDPTVWLINSFVQCYNPLNNTNPIVAAGLVVNENEQIEYSVMDPAYQDAMKYINTLYAEGLLDSQVFTKDSTQHKATIENEEQLVALYAGGGIVQDSAAFYAGEEGRWENWTTLTPVEGPDGVRLAATAITSYWGSSIGSVSATCEYPEIAVALFDFLSSKEASMVQFNGPEGYGWDWTDEGISLSGGTPEYVKYEPMYLREDFDWIDNGFAENYPNAQWQSDAGFGHSTIDFRSAELVDDPKFSLEYILQESADAYHKYAPDSELLVPNLVFEGQDAQAVSEYTLSIGGYANQALVQFITGALDPESDWDTYISTLENMGVANYLEVYQSAYDTFKSAQN